MLIGGDHISNDVITLGTCFSMFVSSSRWLAEIWQLSRRGATGELEVELKFQRRSCKLSFIFPPRRQSARPVLKLNKNPVNVKHIKISTAIACFDWPAFLFRL